MLWKIIYTSQITSQEKLFLELLKNRGLNTKKEVDEYINPKKYQDLDWKDIGIKKSEVKKVVTRIENAKLKKEKVVIFGDYDCDGVCATAILWETLYKYGLNVMPYIPDRFSEGYGLKPESFENEKFKNLNPKLIICVDNGIVAYDAIKKAKELGIDVVVIDHHRKEKKKLQTSYVLHSTSVCGAVLAWFVSKEFSKKINLSNFLELACIGTVADQMPLLGVNRSIVKYGLLALNSTKRIGLKETIKVAGIKQIGIYEIGFLIAPRINAAGRLNHAIDALRLICTTDTKKAEKLAYDLNKTNFERQKVVEEVLGLVLKENQSENVVVVTGKYHEGVIGLASGRITEKIYKPSIIISSGEKISKASARSIEGFNIIEAIKETELILEGGGHPMAAGFSIETSKIEKFRQKINEISQAKLTEEILERKLKIDLEIDFDFIDNELVKFLKQLEPFGQGNYPPIFKTENVEITETKTVGSDGKHLKLKLKQNSKILDAIWFNSQSITTNSQCTIAYTIEENIWNNKSTIQLKIKDLFIG